MANKKIVLIIVIIALLVVLDLVIFLLYFQPRPTLTNLQIQPNVNVAPTAGQEINPLDYVGDSRFEGIYFNEQAVKQQSLKLCYVLADKKKEQQCLLSVQKSLAQSASDANFCLELAGEAEQAECVKNYALINNDSDQCNLIKRADLKEECLTVYVNTNINQGDIKICDLVSPTEKRACLDRVYLAQAMKTKDLANCANITDSVMQIDCQSGAF